MELIDTLKGMLSNDHYERLVAERDQLQIRLTKLDQMIDADSAGILPFHFTDLDILKKQSSAMHVYLNILNRRVYMEGHNYYDN